MKVSYNKSENKRNKVHSSVICDLSHINEAIVQVHVSLAHQLKGSFVIEHSKKKTVQARIHDRVKHHRFKADITLLYGRKR